MEEFSSMHDCWRELVLASDVSIDDGGIFSISEISYGSVLYVDLERDTLEGSGFSELL